MNNYHRYLCLLISSLLSTTTLAGDAFDVDDADSLNFEAFHKPKDDSIKIYNTETGKILGGKKRRQTIKTYQPEEASTLKQKTVAIPPSDVPTQKVAETNLSIAGQRYEIRQRYAFGESQNTSDTPDTAINSLYKQMIKYCPQGWTKEKEWSVPIEGDFYLHYEFTCQ